VSCRHAFSIRWHIYDGSWSFSAQPMLRYLQTRRWHTFQPNDFFFSRCPCTAGQSPNKTFRNSWIARGGIIHRPIRSPGISLFNFSFGATWRTRYSMQKWVWHGWTLCRNQHCWETRGVNPSTLWAFCELQMALTLTCIQLVGLFFK
jgi:hypothetical protein